MPAAAERRSHCQRYEPGGGPPSVPRWRSPVPVP